MESLGVDANREDCCTFLAEQLRLMCTAAKGRRYSIDIIIYSFSIFHKSPACYAKLRKTLCLPSKELLRDISSNMRVDSGNVCQNYLKSRAGQLKPNLFIYLLTTFIKRIIHNLMCSEALYNKAS